MLKITLKLNHIFSWGPENLHPITQIVGQILAENVLSNLIVPVDSRCSSFVIIVDNIDSLYY